MIEDSPLVPGGARTPAAETIRARRAEGPGLLSRIPGMAYQCRNDRDWTMEFVSVGCRALTGYEPVDLLGSSPPTFASLIHADDRDAVWDHVQRSTVGGRPFDIEYRIRTADGEERWVWDRGHAVLSETGEILGLEGFITDVTARKELEERLLRSQKLEALGELTGSIAHDFNNLLTAIIAPVEVLLDNLESEDPVARELESIHETAQYAAALTQQLLAFCRKQVRIRRVVDLRQLVDLMGDTLRRITGERVQVVTRLAADSLAVRVDPSHLEQVLVNLVVNARDAMLPEGGVVEVTVERAELDERRAGRLQLGRGAHVVLAVRDRGPGIPPEIRERLFDPFFTTKEEGTGLGLSTVYGIVTHHEGAVEVESEAGQGSLFRVYLPLVDAAVEDLTVAPLPRRRRPSGTGTVLLVEDDRRVREATANALRRYGFRVLTAEDRDGALARADAEGADVDVILSDVLLADVSGPELMDELRARMPRARAVYVSGYAEDEAARHIDRDGRAVLLRKPFSLSALLEAVSGEASGPEGPGG